jgi:hypothetical protein
MKYTLLSLALLSACHGFAMQQQQSQIPASPPNSATPLIQKTTPKTSILIALANGMSPTNMLKKMFSDAISQQQ